MILFLFFACALIVAMPTAAWRAGWFDSEPLCDPCFEEFRRTMRGER